MTRAKVAGLGPPPIVGGYMLSKGEAEAVALMLLYGQRLEAVTHIASRRWVIAHPRRELGSTSAGRLAAAGIVIAERHRPGWDRNLALHADHLILVRPVCPRLADYAERWRLTYAPTLESS